MKKAYIKTFGCQMNEHDSARMLAMLMTLGYQSTEQIEEADIILVNTCSVRANPQNKVYSFLGTLKELKKRKSELIIAVCGCVAQQEGERILEKSPIVDMVIGTDQYFELPRWIEQVQQGKRVCALDRVYAKPPILDFIPEKWLEKGHREGPKAYVVISKGCNNACSFCIVPRTRGREVYRTPENILLEVRSALSDGAKEIWLLGQNVNAYKFSEQFRFVELLELVSRESDAWRIRFTSPHPRDWSQALTDLIAERTNIAHHVHLPLQSGNNRILKLMRRGHTIETYLDHVNYLKKRIPDIEISTDLIVGFPTETEEEFEDTLRVVQEVRFSQVYPFKYSPRPGTYAEKLGDTVPRAEKEERLARLIAVQEEINNEAMQRLIGTVQEVLIEEAHPRRKGFWNGRTNPYRPISVEGSDLKVGMLVSADVTGFQGHWLEARCVHILKKP